MYANIIQPIGVEVAQGNVVRCRYNAVNHTPPPKKKKKKKKKNIHTINTGELWSVCCDFKVWFTFCWCHLGADDNIVVNWAML